MKGKKAGEGPIGQSKWLGFGVTGCPLVLEHALSILEAKVIDQIDLGTHIIFIGDTVNAEVLKDGRPLTHRYYQEFLKGKAPATAPTYNPVK